MEHTEYNSPTWIAALLVSLICAALIARSLVKVLAILIPVALVVALGDAVWQDVRPKPPPSPEKQRLAALFSESQTPTRTLASLSLQWFHDQYRTPPLEDRVANPNSFLHATVTDVGLQYTLESRAQGVTFNDYIWFGNVRAMHRDYSTATHLHRLRIDYRGHYPSSPPNPLTGPVTFVEWHSYTEEALKSAEKEVQSALSQWRARYPEIAAAAAAR